MCNHSNLYFEKIENGTAYRIYLMDYGNDPWLCRSALGAADGMHEELVISINETNAVLYSTIIDNYAPVIGYEKANETARDVSIALIVAILQAEGWTMFSE